MAIVFQRRKPESKKKQTKKLSDLFGPAHSVQKRDVWGGGGGRKGFSLSGHETHGDLFVYYSDVPLMNRLSRSLLLAYG